MKRRTFLILLALVLVGVGGYYGVRQVLKGPVPVGEVTPRPTGEGWVDLLDAQHAGGWKNVTDQKDIFELKDGMIHIFGRMIPPLRYVGYATEQFGDFELHAEFKVTRHANSGVFLRSTPNDPVYRGFEIQVLEDYGKAPDKNSCGSLYDIATPMFNMSRPVGEWNSYDIRLKGKELTVQMNGWMILHLDLAKMVTPLGKFKVAYTNLPLEGTLMLQDHGGEVWYRNIMIRKLQ